MNNKPNSELIDEENPEWTAVMFNTAKTADEFAAQLNEEAELNKTIMENLARIEL